MSDSDLRQALLGTWRLVSFQSEVQGTLVKPFGDEPLGYLVYTADGHVFVILADRERPELFRSAAGRGPVLLDTAQPNTPFGFIGHCGTFEVRDGQAIHHYEVSFRPSVDGGAEVRSVEISDDRLILGDPGHGSRLEWRRVHCGSRP
jgi:hypothetical protein